MRAIRLLIAQEKSTDSLVRTSYDRIAAGYDLTWTSHMRGLTEAMLYTLGPQRDCRCLDLTCGTGFVAGWLARHTAEEVIGVDASAGMLEIARSNYPKVRFVQADAAEYVRALARHSFDVVTCCWGLGYTRPITVIGQASRILRPGGRLAVIDNGLFSLAEVMWTSLLTFAETPESLVHAMRVRFLPGVWALTGLMRVAGLSVIWQDAGRKSYFVPDGQAAVDRLLATGAAAGFEFAARPRDKQRVFDRFAELLDQRYRNGRGVRITHRYLAAIGRKR